MMSEAVQWRPWQQQVIEEMKEEGDGKTIHWIWDKTFDAGKTFLGKYLRASGQAQLVGQCNIASLRRLLYQAQKIPHSTTIVIDASFDMELCHYEALRFLKEGMINFPKAEGLILNHPPHVIVLANYPPQIELIKDTEWKISIIEDYHQPMSSSN